MTFYIPQFWIGVLVTILLEILGVLIIAIYNAHKIKKNKGDKK